MRTCEILTLTVLMCFACAPVRADLVAHWAFEGNANDSAGSNHGTNHGGTWTTGKIGGAISLNGSSNYVGVPASSTLDFSGSYSISAWLKPTATPDHHMNWFGYYDEQTTGRNFVLRVYPGGKIRYASYGDAIDEPNVMNFGEWNHVTAVYDYGTSMGTVYFNGSAIISDDLTSYLGDLVTTTIGKWNVSFEPQGYFDGLIDEVGVWDHALSPSEVMDVYVNGIPEPSTLFLFGIGTCLLARYRRRC